MPSEAYRIDTPAGLPPLSLGKKPLSFFEFWPGWLFYAPVVVCALFFMLRYRGMLLPTVANPAFPTGGIVGESKAAILEVAERHLGARVASFISCHRGKDSASNETRTALSALEQAGLRFPLVAKPDKGCRGAGVRPLYNPEDLASYIAHFPEQTDFVIQRMVDSEGEAGVFYVREPGQAKGRILSLTLKYFPYVVGDGTSTLRALITNDSRASRLSSIYMPRFEHMLDTIPAAGKAVRLAFAGNHSKGTIFRNGNAYITPEMTAMFDRLSQKIPGFHFGRYDIRFDDFAALCRGEEAFTIIEINGAGAESTHIWDANNSLLHAWRDLITQCHLAWKIGAAHRDAGAVALTPAAMWADYRHEKRMTKLYPSTY